MGLSTALDEMTLVLFTTLAPSGAIAICILALLALICPMGDAQRARLDKFFYLPLIATMAGLIASATHLGTPSNALYTFLGLGKSPLSNEVFAAVCFLALSGVYWLCSFLPLRVSWLRRVWLAAIAVLGVIFVGAIAFAYEAEPIVTWHTAMVPLALCANACVGGPILAAMTLRIAKWGQPGEPGGGAGGADGGAGSSVRGSVRSNVRSRTLYGVLMLVAVVGLGVSVGAYVVQGVWLDGMSNHLANANQLVPDYWMMVVAYTLLCGAGLILSRQAAKAFLAPDCRRPEAQAAGQVLHSTPEPGSKKDAVIADAAPRHVGIKGNRPSAFDIAALICVFAGIFIMRFAFYMMHMTVGVGL